MVNKILNIPLTKQQISLIKKFLLRHKIKCDNKNQFGLIAEPKIDKEKLIIRLLSIAETGKVDKFLQRNGLYNEV